MSLNRFAEHKTIQAIKAWQFILTSCDKGVMIASRQSVREELIRLWRDLYVIRKGYRYYGRFHQLYVGGVDVS